MGSGEGGGEGAKNRKEVGEKRKRGRGFGEKEGRILGRARKSLEDNILLEKQLFFFFRDHFSWGK